MRLSDIPPGTKDEKARFMPSPKSKGHLHLSFPTHPPPPSHLPMSLFRPSHFPMGVIGIASCSHTDSLTNILAEFNAAVHDLFGPESIYPLAKNCFVFEEGDGTTNLNLGDHLPGLVIIPSMMGNKKENIETLLADLCSNILGEFSTVLQLLESPLGNEYLNAALFPIPPSATELPKPIVDEPEGMLGLPSYNSQPELSASAALRGKAALAMKRTSSTGPSLTPSRQSTLAAPVSKKRQSAIGAVSSHGRLFKVLGDFFLLAARTEDASVWYTEAIALFKSPIDSIWHASALEGLATVALLDAWSLGQGLQASFSNSREPWGDVLEKLNQAVAIYARADPASDSDHHYDLLSYLYITAVLRQSSLMFATWSSKGWGPLAFTALLHPGPTPYLAPTLSQADANAINQDRLSSISGISRSQIATLLAQAHGPWLLHLGHRERIGLLEAIASMYSSLGYHRKEAYILREVIGCILDLVVCGRDESASSMGFGLQSAGLGSHGDIGTVGRKGNERPEGNESLLKLVKYVCKVHGINLEAVKVIEPATGDLKRDSQTSSVDGQSDAGEEVDDPYGWPELQIGIVREALAVAEALPDSVAAAQFALSALKSLHSVLGEEDQYHFYSTSSRALNTARRRGDKRRVDYWSGQPIVSIELLPIPPVRMLAENPISILNRHPSAGPKTLRLTDPFLYNPRRSLMTQGRTLVVKDEVLEFVVTLRNPYVFDLEIENLELSTSGVPFETKPTSLTIPAQSFHSVTMTGKPTSTGELIIRGCYVQASGGASREFILPLSTAEEEDRKSRRRSTIACESGRSKYAGLDSRPWEKEGKRRSLQKASTSKASSKTLHFMECKVVPEQPLLRIRWSSLTHGALMLYNGETSTIRLTLENISSLPINFLRLTFDDSTIAPAQQALSEGELSVFDTYETEYDLIRRPAFSWDVEGHVCTIPPGRKLAVTISCLGKVGCSSGSVHVAYGYAQPEQDATEDHSGVFHTRRLTYPVLVTVYHMLECHGMDILPFSAEDGESPDVEGRTGGLGQARRELLKVGDEAGWCLFSVDVRNTYGLPFEVEFTRIHEGVPEASATCLVAPGSTSRIVIPLKKFLLPEDVTTQPIPTLSDRQFIVTKSALTSAEEKAQRELFWYREELFKCIRGRWREAGGSRSGDLHLRQQRMTLVMLETLRTETVRVHLTLVRREGDEQSEWATVDKKQGNFLPKPYDYVYLRTRVTNLSLAPLVLTLDFGMEPSEYVIQEGILSDVPVGRLAQGESYETETPLCFVACGRFELTAEARVLGASGDDARVGFGQLHAIVEEP
ncbi:hypothetical protein DENSPDRAFT_775745 [Dentipellis sp. KUC8613]|nr:hypothetical protein DENSPDRAFT_775745 [Dentipellis sp. KUC8613]